MSSKIKPFDSMPEATPEGNEKYMIYLFDLMHEGGYERFKDIHGNIHETGRAAAIERFKDILSLMTNTVSLSWVIGAGELLREIDGIDKTETSGQTVLDNGRFRDKVRAIVNQALDGNFEVTITLNDNCDFMQEKIKKYD